MTRGLRPDEIGLWTVVTSTIRPIPGRAPKAAAVAVAVTAPVTGARPTARTSSPAPVRPPSPPAAPRDIEPGRRRRIIRGRDDIAARLDLHGLDQDRARAALLGFLRRAQAEGARAVLVITGKGLAGEGVLKRRVPEWLADPVLRPVVAGLSAADARHGGQGALYVALKRLGR